ncbi:hypothetical protein A8C75_22680 [Marinobacterium aestuarii]|uniref:DUF2938 domain-containing protein n=1 Tax=Marinobacterium aestuarii TaxID=1821621 RepID=A0A1A9F456_9GAMM|nr:DUF2938 domain-containing protein [Marinobacterium aestuarii]ANG65007.1 hypothetical protein A8C75_22680 [Marinobacterium aestuarii]
MNVLAFTLLTGIGATLVMDLWGLVRARLFGIPAADYAMVGRWLGHMPRGRFRHGAISRAAAVTGETLIGWSAHYLTGIAYAALLTGIWGSDWISHPSIGPALIVGIGTIAAPFLLMQPGMGAGIAASRTPRPNAARFHSLLNHAIFGLGLYLAAVTISLFLQA